MRFDGIERGPIPVDEAIPSLSADRGRSRGGAREGNERPMVEDRAAMKWPKSWSPDGQVLLFDQFDRETKPDVWASR
jgi:hypothetical protein